MTNMTDRPAGRRPFRPKRLKTALPKPRAMADAPVPAAKDAERIAKVMARAGVASRREAEAWIAAGRVSVNGAVISSPALNVTAKDRVAIDGKPMPRKERTRLFLFHKPRGLVTTSADPQGRPTIFGALPGDLPRLVSVGRLDLNTEGLLLLTNDGGLARALELPATGWLRRYRVRAFGEVDQPRLDALRKGIVVDGVQYGSIEAALERVQGDNVWLTFAMREGKNREIRNVMRALGLHVNRLIRVSYGPFQLADLPAGAVEEVRTRTLRDQLGERLAALAGADFSGPLTEREAADERPVPRPGSRSGPPARGAREPHRPADAGGRREQNRAKPLESKPQSTKPQSTKPQATKSQKPNPRAPKAGTAQKPHGPREEVSARPRTDNPQHRRHRPHRGKRTGPRPARPKER
jgi:23S rRNA pseudouridine2605 synthase